MKHLELYDNFRAIISKEKIFDMHYLTDFILDCGIYLNAKSMDISEEIVSNMGGLKSKQYPQELAKLLIFMGKNRDNINSYLEIGCERAGTFFIVDSYMKALKDHWFKSTAIDITNMAANKFKSYSKKFPSSKFIQVDMRSDEAATIIYNNKADFCFIDAKHTYENVKADYELIIQHTQPKYIGFHDIKLTHIPKVQVHRFWDEIKRKYTHTELINTDDRFVGSIGIGIIFILRYLNNERRNPRGLQARPTSSL